MLNALKADQSPCELFDPPRLAVDYQDFQAPVIVEMRMTRRNHQLVVGVLNVCQLLRYPVGVMVVDERNRAHNRCIRTRCSLRYKAIADQIAEGFRSVGIAQPRDEVIKTFEEIRIECNPSSGKDAQWLLLKKELPLEYGEYHDHENRSTTLH